MTSDDPDFESKAADVIGLYLNPPQHAAVFSLDEKTQVQALDRLDPVLPLSPGRLERHGFEYYRHGTLSLYGALNTRTGRVIGTPVEQHNSAAFVAFLESLLASVRGKREVHVVLDNLSVPQESSRRALPRGASETALPFHADLLVMAEPGGDLVLQDRRQRCGVRKFWHSRADPRLR